MMQPARIGSGVDARPGWRRTRWDRDVTALGHRRRRRVADGLPGPVRRRCRRSLGGRLVRRPPVGPAGAGSGCRHRRPRCPRRWPMPRCLPRLMPRRDPRGLSRQRGVAGSWAVSPRTPQWASGGGDGQRNRCRAPTCRVRHGVFVRFGLRPRPSTRADLLACVAEDQHSLPLHALGQRSPSGHCDAHPRRPVPADALASAVRRIGPRRGVPLGADARVRRSAAVRAAAGVAPGDPHRARRPGWRSTEVPDGVTYVDDLAAAVERLSETVLA